MVKAKRRVAKNAGKGDPWIDESLIFPGVEEYINRLAEGLNIPPALIIQNMLIRRIAEEDAAINVYGQSPKLLYEFMDQDGELVTGQELYEKIKSMEENRLRTEYAEKLMKIPFEALRPDQQEFLKGLKMDPESKEKEKEDQADLQALIDSGDLILDEGQIQPKDRKSIYEP